VRAFQKDPATGKQNQLADLKEGAFFGEISILTGQPRMASVVALNPVRAVGARPTHPRRHHEDAPARLGRAPRVCGEARGAVAALRPTRAVR